MIKIRTTEEIHFEIDLNPEDNWVLINSLPEEIKLLIQQRMTIEKVVLNSSELLRLKIEFLNKINNKKIICVVCNKKITTKEEKFTGVCKSCTKKEGI